MSCSMRTRIMIQTALWRLLAASAVLLGAIGIAVPGLPTVPFLLVAAWAGSHGWPELERRLLAHPTYGPSIRRWRENRSVPRKAKWLASALIATSITLILITPAPELLQWLLPPLLILITLWLWSRPDA